MVDAIRPELLASALAGAGATERWSVLGDEPLLAVDLRAPEDPGGDASRLAELPAVTVGRVEAEVAPALRPWADRVDVLASTDEELERVVAAVRANPLASLCLVQLLRHSEGRGIHDGLVAESLVYATLQGGPEFAAWRATRPAATAPDEEPAPLRTERKGECLHVVLDRAHKRNAFSARMRDAFCEVLALAYEDPSLRRIEWSAEGPSFCAGGDLDEFGTAPDPATAHAIRSTRNPGRLLAAVASRVHARIHGACVGAGIELPAFCADVHVKGDAFFQLPEVGMGLVPGAGGTVSLPRRIGRQRTAWMALTGARIPAELGLRWGLVDAIDPGR